MREITYIIDGSSDDGTLDLDNLASPVVIRENTYEYMNE